MITFRLLSIGQIEYRKCCICKINNKPVWHDLFYITKHSAIITISIRLSVYGSALIWFFLPSKARSGKTGRENYKTFWLIFDKVEFEKVIQASFPPTFFRSSILLRQGNKIQSQINIINYPDYN